MGDRRRLVPLVLATVATQSSIVVLAPLVVEIGIFFDVVVAVMVLGILVFRIRETFSSMDVSKLNELKW